ncbi:hypothetical protein AAF712_015399 [Marasmius tenuissimus]|uniref:Uncharacterized protein n=1 Tax=Marasmius tenuissimus TaxID=585030 RepID=A0ABR2Z9H6_9AGAR
MASALLLYLVFSFPHFLFANAKTVTRYIDDTYGDSVTGLKPEYHADHENFWQDQTCGSEQGCAIVPDTRKTRNGTYSAATYQPEMSNLGFTLRFNGTGITVYFILAGDQYPDIIVRQTQCDFKLDGVVKKNYVYRPVPSDAMEYEVPVYTVEGLDNGPHVLEVETGKKSFPVFMAFDYATYMIEEPDEEETASIPSTPSTKIPVGAIVGGVIGGLVLFVCGGLVFFLHRKRRQRGGLPSGNRGIWSREPCHIVPFMAQDDSNSTPYPRLKHSSTNITSISDDPFRDFGGKTGPLGSRSSSPMPLQGGRSSEKALLRQQQLSRMREELSSLQNRQNSTVPSEAESSELSVMRQQIRQLQEQLQSVRSQSQSHIHSVEDLPPPGYTS